MMSKAEAEAEVRAVEVVEQARYLEVQAGQAPV